jgi:hypothetical protein
MSKKYLLKCFKVIYEEVIDADSEQEAWEKFGVIADHQNLDSSDEDLAFRVIELELDEDEEGDEEGETN